MSESGHLKQQLLNSFGSSDLYVILGVSPAATNPEIKKAYMKLALVHHPDKGGETAKFQALSLVHSILSDDEKRKLYDTFGPDGYFDSEGTSGDEENFDFWYAYFRNIFPAISVQDITSFSKTYIGSEEEKNDVIEAYKRYDGNGQHIMDSVMFAEEGEEHRIIGLIEKAIEDGAIKSTSSYRKFKSKIETSDSGSKQKKKSTKKSKNDDEALVQAILAQQQNRNKESSKMLSGIFSKYGASDFDSEDISEEEFQRTQKAMKRGNKEKR